MGTLNDIRQALESEVTNITDIPPVTQRSWQNKKFDPTPGTPYVRLSMIPIEIRPAVMGPTPSYLHTGLFVIDICVPEDTGSLDAEALADQVRSRYNVDTGLSNGSIVVRIRYSEIREMVEDPPWYMIPVVVEWYCYET